ncbi:chemotaxis protein MotB [Pseudooceanicola sediminis]|uniref:Chemotaxis protein MotB n=1 Tax=Pseudooceanicola sediminis TaxID=2211117 RepID=A0A399J6U1_9RHOB|nr:flagellar motor protein MotB [Pseudooceanicola sediminis]KAA2315529.1 OmpA family protein [Puniceibacterium sp. HSS470]RII40267.1 chemotaxis protein MotB [Pseudooceanicola sediminis]|tara:strand:- start:65924 stop:66757 length:834 start_codon:yes stop_codon:yes gene_type:complete
MAGQSNVAPVIIKRKKVVGGGGHHGGAWKVAYADFVTAMMAFFLLMWLLNATTEQQRSGIADYFSPTIPINKVSGGGDGAFGGESVFSEIVLPEVGTGSTSLNPTAQDKSSGRENTEAEDAETKALEEIEKMLAGNSGESDVHPDLLRHIISRVTDEGLVIELFDTDNATLFVDDTLQATPLLTQIASMLVRVTSIVSNKMAVEGHVRARPVVLNDNPVWGLSTQRAEEMRRLMIAQSLDPDRIIRVTGHADRELSARNPMSARNNRLEIILLRSDR